MDGNAGNIGVFGCDDGNLSDPKTIGFVCIDEVTIAEYGLSTTIRWRNRFTTAPKGKTTEHTFDNAHAIVSDHFVWTEKELERAVSRVRGRTYSAWHARKTNRHVLKGGGIADQVFLSKSAKEHQAVGQSIEVGLSRQQWITPTAVVAGAQWWLHLAWHIDAFHPTLAWWPAFHRLQDSAQSHPFRRRSQVEAIQRQHRFNSLEIKKVYIQSE